MPMLNIEGSTVMLAGSDGRTAPEYNSLAKGFDKCSKFPAITSQRANPIPVSSIAAGCRKNFISGYQQAQRRPPRSFAGAMG
jgi:hypothetical protein